MMLRTADALSRMAEKLSEVSSTRSEVTSAGSREPRESNSLKRFPKCPGRKLGEKGTLGQAVFGWLEEFDAMCAERHITNDLDKMAWFRECIDTSNKELREAAISLRKFEDWKSAKRYLIRTLVEEEKRLPYQMWQRVEKLSYLSGTVESFATKFLTVVDDYHAASAVSVDVMVYKPSYTEQLDAWFTSFNEPTVVSFKDGYLGRIPNLTLEEVVEDSKMRIESLFTALRKMNARGPGKSQREREPRRDKDERPRYEPKIDRRNDRSGNDRSDKPRVTSTSDKPPYRKAYDKPVGDTKKVPSREQNSSSPSKSTEKRSVRKVDDGSNPKACYRCGDPGHFSNACPAPADKRLPLWRGHLMSNARDDEERDYDPADEDKYFNLFQLSRDSEENPSEGDSTESEDEYYDDASSSEEDFQR